MSENIDYVVKFFRAGAVGTNVSIPRGSLMLGIESNALGDSWVKALVPVQPQRRVDDITEDELIVIIARALDAVYGNDGGDDDPVEYWGAGSTRAAAEIKKRFTTS